jgi:hypothetical protein
MPINELIARGITPIGAGLPQVANMLQQKRQQEFENAFITSQQAKQAANEKAALDEAERKYLANGVQHLVGITDPQQFEMVKQQYISDPKTQSILQRLNVSPEMITPENVNAVATRLKMSAGQAPAEPQVIQTPDGGQTSLYNPDTRTAAPLVSNPKDRPTTMTPYEQARIDLERSRLSQKGASGAAKPSDALAPDAVHDAVIDTLADPNRIRQYASFGQSGQSNRNAINNAKAKLLRDIGLTEQEVIRQQAIAKGQVKSVGDLVGMQNAVSAYEAVAKGNGDRVLELVDKVNTAGIPILNSAKRLGEQALGNPDAAELMQVLQNYQTEVARIIANPRLVGQLTDTARKEIMQTVPANMTPAQAKRIVNRLNFEFELRNKGISDAISNAQGQMVPGFNQTTPAVAPATGQPVRVNTPEEAMKLAPGTVFITPDGRQKVR